MTADDRPQTALARLGRLTSDLLRPFVWVAAVIGLLIAAIPPAPRWQEYEAEAWAVPPVRATIAWFPESGWQPGAVTVARLGETTSRRRALWITEQDYASTGLRLRRSEVWPSDWAAHDPDAPAKAFDVGDFGPLTEVEKAEIDAFWRARQPHSVYIADVTLWAFLLPAALVAGWRAWCPPTPAGPPGLVRRLVRPWVWTFALLGGAAMTGPFTRAWLPTDWPWWEVNGQIGPATTPHPRLIAIEANWGIDPPPPPVSALPDERVGRPRWGVWMTCGKSPVGGMGGLGGGGGFGGGAFSLPPLGTQIGGAIGGGGPRKATARWRTHATLRISLWWLLLPAELANLVTLFRSRPRPRRAVPASPPPAPA